MVGLYSRAILARIFHLPGRTQKGGTQFVSCLAIPVPPRLAQADQASQAEAELAAVRAAVHRGSPLGSDAWQCRIVKRLGLESTLRPRGRPRKMLE